jgi:hypothetical protein
VRREAQRAVDFHGFIKFSVSNSLKRFFPGKLGPHKFKLLLQARYPGSQERGIGAGGEGGDL